MNFSLATQKSNRNKCDQIWDRRRRRISDCIAVTWNGQAWKTIKTGKYMAHMKIYSKNIEPALSHWTHSTMQFFFSFTKRGLILSDCRFQCSRNGKFNYRRWNWKFPWRTTYYYPFDDLMVLIEAAHLNQLKELTYVPFWYGFGRVISNTKNRIMLKVHLLTL